jgi:anti-anti-sigma regulatory factor
MKNPGVSITTKYASPYNIQILLEGQLTIKNAASIQRDLLSVLNSSQNINLVLKNVVKIDLAVLQLLLALQKSAATHNKKLSFDNELTGNIESVLLSSGLQKKFITESKNHLNGVH